MNSTPAILSGPIASREAVRFYAAPKFSVLFISGLAAAAIPLILSFYWIGFWVAPDSMGLPLRVSVSGGALFLAFLWYRAPLSHAEVNLFRALALAGILWFITTLTATDRAHAFSGWIKMLLLFVVCCGVARGLRHPATARVFGLFLLTGAGILGAFILFSYVRYEGFTVPSFKAAREFKGTVLTEALPLNNIAFSAVFSYLSGLCLVPGKRLLIALGIPLFAICTFFTGSRAPFAILGVSILILVCINGLRSRSSSLQIASAALALGATLGAATLVMLSSDKEINAATEGRSHLWPVGIRKFQERPLFGFGYESWRDDLVSRLPGEYDLTLDLAQKFGGGYHNQYISVLAEEGLIGGLAAALILCLLLRSCWLLAFRRWAAVEMHQWPLFACLFLLLRANIEVPGLFGYAQEPADYLAYVFLAIVVSRFSVEEDYARLLARSRGAVAA
jgi:O-antigen ligase